MSEAPEQSEWISVAEAASSAGLPVRTVYNWLRNGSIESQKQDGATCVRIADVLARAAERKVPERKELPSSTTSLAVPTVEACITELPSIPPDLLSHFIRLFEQGVPLPNIVEQMRIPPALAIEARRQYDLLVAASGQPSILDRMNTIAERLERRLELLESTMEEIDRKHSTANQQFVDEVVLKLRPSLLRVEQQVAELRNRCAIAEHQETYDVALLSGALNDLKRAVVDILERGEGKPQ